MLRPVRTERAIAPSDVPAVNPVVEAIYRTGKVEDAEGIGRDCYPHSIPPESGFALYEFVRTRGADRTLEVGMAYGLSTLHFCQAHRDKGRGTHTAIDPSQSRKWQSIGLLNLRRAGLDDLLTFHEARNYEALPRLLAAGERFDLALIDGSHLFDHALIDFSYIDLMLETGGHVFFDDLWMPAIRKVIGFVLANRAYEVAPVPRCRPDPTWRCAVRLARNVLHDPFARGWALARIPGNLCALRKTGADTRPWSFHRPF
jgi:predicted O-methyltransferase YrrM